MDDFESLLALTTIPLLGSIKIRLLIQHFGSATEAVKAPTSALAELPGFGPKILQAWELARSKNHWKQDLFLAEQQGVTLIPYTSSNYPKRLLEIIDHPLILYVKGTWLKEDQRSLAIVGTRQASIYGLEMAQKISRELAQSGFTVVSGFARGIDTAAHEGALTKGRTIGVLGSGLCHLYPKENMILAREIIENGALISEFPMATPPDRQLFPQRNRIVSGMTLGTVLIEAPLQSGAMITMDRARSQERKCFALPGRADQDNFQGNHALIKQKKAELIENAEDILHHFNNLFGTTTLARPIQSPLAILEVEEKNLWQQLPSEELSIEEIAIRTKHPIAKLNVLLISLVLKKVLKEYPGKIYKKIS